MFDANLTIGFGASGYGYGIDGSILMPEGSGDVRYDFASTGRANGDLVQTFATGSVFTMNGTMTGIGDACLDNDCTIHTGRAHVLTPVTNAHIVCHTLLEK